MPVTTGIRVKNVSKHYLEPGNATSCKASAAVTGRRFVAIQGPGSLGNLPAVRHATAAGRIYGVSENDITSGGYLNVLRRGTFEVEAGAAITAGTFVEVGANGVAVPLAAGIAVGVCTADTTNGAGAPITLMGL